MTAILMRIPVRSRRALMVFNRVCPAKDIGDCNILRKVTETTFRRLGPCFGRAPNRAAYGKRSFGFAGQGALLIAQPFDGSDNARRRVPTSDACCR